MAEQAQSLQSVMSSGGGQSGGGQSGQFAAASGGNAIAKAFMSFAGIASDMAAAKREAYNQGYQAQEDILRGRKAANELTDALLDRLAQGRVAFAANNVSLTSGAAQNFARDAQRRAGLAEEQTTRSFTTSALTRRRQAIDLIKNSRVAAKIGTIGTLMELNTDLAKAAYAGG